jgi:arylsulfatase
MFVNRGIYHEGWTACTRHGIPWLLTGKLPKIEDDVWELYAPDDWTQANNIAAQNPAKLKELQQLFMLEGARYNVFPLDDRTSERTIPSMAGRPDLLAGRTSQTLYTGMSHLNENTVLDIKNRSHAVTAEITVPDARASGAIIAQGGRSGGWGLFLRSGVPTHVYNFFGFDHVYARATQPLTAGKHTVRYEFKYDGGGVGKGGMGTLFVDGQQVGEARLSRTIPFLFSLDGADIGVDYGSPVTEDYETPFGRFTGEISWVRIDIGKEVFEDAAGEEEALAGRS